MKLTKNLLPSFLAMAAMTCGASAADYEWNGATDTDFGTAGNWNVGGSPAGAPPGSSDETFFNSLPSNQAILNSSISVRGLTFQAGATGADWDLGGGGTTLTLTSGTAIDFETGFGQDVTIDADIVSTQQLGFHLQDQGSLTLNGDLTGANVWEFRDGIFNLNGSNSGMTTVYTNGSGTVLNAATDTSLGSSSFRINGGEVEVGTGGSGDRNYAVDFQFMGGYQFRVTGGQNITFSGANNIIREDVGEKTLKLTAGSTLTFTNGLGTVVNNSGAPSANETNVKTEESGLMVLGGSTDFNGGRLRLRNSTTVQLDGVLTDTTLLIEGSATFNGDGVIEFTDAMFAEGTPIDVNGLFDATNLEFDLTGLTLADYDLLDYSGGTFDGPGSLDDLLTASSQSMGWTLFDSGSVISASLVPEPTTSALVFAGMAFLVARRRRA